MIFTLRREHADQCKHSIWAVIYNTGCRVGVIGAKVEGGLQPCCSGPVQLPKEFGVELFALSQILGFGVGADQIRGGELRRNTWRFVEMS
jgi:hypothetical protein